MADSYGLLVELDKATDFLKAVRKIEALRIANQAQVKFIYTVCDRGGTARLRDVGLRYSTLSTPFGEPERQLVVLCIAVSNRNMRSVNPLRLVGGTAVDEPDALLEQPTGGQCEFTRIETIAELGRSFDAQDAPPAGPQ